MACQLLSLPWQGSAGRLGLGPRLVVQGQLASYLGYLGLGQGLGPLCEACGEAHIRSLSGRRETIRFVLGLVTLLSERTPPHLPNCPGLPSQAVKVLYAQSLRLHSRCTAPLLQRHLRHPHVRSSWMPRPAHPSSWRMSPASASPPWSTGLLGYTHNVRLTPCAPVCGHTFTAAVFKRPLRLKNITERRYTRRPPQPRPRLESSSDIPAP